MKTPRLFVPMSLAVLLAPPLGCSDSAEPGPTPAPPMADLQVGERPESVTKGFNGLLYVSVQNASGMGDDGEVKVVDGTTVKTFASGLKEPKGIAFVANHLIVTDVTRVWKIDSSGTKSVLAEGAAFPSPVVFLNDAAVDPGKDAVFVTEMGQIAKAFNPSTNALWPTTSMEATAIMPEARVYRITVPAGEVSIAIDKSPDMLLINGVTSPAAGRLLVAEFFYGNLFEVMGTTTKMLATGYRGADGIEQDEAGNIYVTSYSQGKVWKLDRDGKNEKVLLDGRGPGSTADQYLDLPNRRLVIPDTGKGVLIYLPIP
jgi:sugar lactone lactonase YvrE